MKAVGRFASFVLVSLTSIVITITACGGGSSQPGGGGGIGTAARALIFNANPLGLHITRGFGPSRASLEHPAAFTVDAQTTTPGGGNFAGFCDLVGVASPGARVQSGIFGLGLWASGACNTVAAPPGPEVGVTIPQAGQIGNVSLDAVGTGSGVDDGNVGLNSTASGQIQVVVLHADGTQTITPITCTLGVSSAAKVHCDDKNSPAHHTDVVAGDQVAAHFWYNGGDSYTAIRVNIEYATPTF